MAGLKPLFSTRDLEKFYDKFEETTEEKIVKILIEAGEKAVAKARIDGKYNDITGNLRSSIGYAVVKNGSILISNTKEAERGSDRKKGVAQSERLIRELAREYSRGYVLILVAGMDYAIYVESINGKDVIASSATWGERYLRTTIKKVLEYGG